MTDTDHDNPQRPSKTQQKRDADALQALGERLIALPEQELARLALPDELLDAVRHGQRLQGTRGALRRQRLYIGKLMRGLDVSNLQAALAHLDQQAAVERAHFHVIEQWRSRLLSEGPTALEEFFDLHPRAERQKLRQLVTAARKEMDAGKTPRKQRELFRELRRLLEESE